MRMDVSTSRIGKKTGGRALKPFLASLFSSPLLFKNEQSILANEWSWFLRNSSEIELRNKPLGEQTVLE
jgi:hypothetical protein